MDEKKTMSESAWYDDDAPELTGEQLDRAEFAIGGEVIRPATGTLTRGPGRPPMDQPKQSVTIRLDHDLVEALRASGSGWQSRVNDALRTLLDEGGIQGVSGSR